MRCTFLPPKMAWKRWLETRYILSVLELVRKDARFFSRHLAALALRLVFVLHFPAVMDDSRLYADIAENWLQHGVYGITDSGQIMPTLSRLPGYPAFLAAIFAVFGWGNFRAVLLIQGSFDLGTCFLVADLARRFASSVRRRLLPAGRAFHPGQLLGRRSDRDPGNIFHNVSPRFNHVRIRPPSTATSSRTQHRCR